MSTSATDSSYFLFICTPCFANSLNVGYLHSILRLKDLLATHNIRHELATIGNESLITRARNYFVSVFLSNPAYTHMMFIDSDITFDARSIVRMLRADKDMIGGAYPKKSIHWDRLARASRTDTDWKQVEPQLYDYAVNIVPFEHDRSSTLHIKGGVMKVAYIATGFMMLRRNMLLSMIQQYPELKFFNDVPAYDNGKNAELFYCLFDCIIEPKTHRYLSEDYAFCDRWVQMGGEIWVDLMCNLNHTGSYEFKGSFIEHIRPFLAVSSGNTDASLSIVPKT